MATQTSSFASMSDLVKQFGSRPGQINRRKFHNLRLLVDPAPPILTSAFSWAAKVLDRRTLSELDSKIGHGGVGSQSALPIIKCKNIGRALGSATPKQESVFLWMAAKLEPDTLAAIDRIIARNAETDGKPPLHHHRRKPAEHEARH